MVIVRFMRKQNGKLLTDIDDVIPNKDSSAFSVKRAGEHAGDFMTRMGIE